MLTSIELSPQPLGPIFVSHSSTDRDDVIALCKAIRLSLNDQIRTFHTSAGVIAPGDRWRDRILSAIADCALVIVWATPSGIESREVAFELGAALALSRPLIPCCVHVAPETLPWSLDEIQALTLLDKEDDWIRLAHSIATFVNFTGRVNEEPLTALAQRFKSTSDAVDFRTAGRTVEGPQHVGVRGSQSRRGGR